jgi:hypothetical protein
MLSVRILAQAHMHCFLFSASFKMTDCANGKNICLFCRQMARAARTWSNFGQRREHANQRTAHRISVEQSLFAVLLHVDWRNHCRVQFNNAAPSPIAKSHFHIAAFFACERLVRKIRNSFDPLTDQLLRMRTSEHSANSFGEPAWHKLALQHVHSEWTPPSDWLHHKLSRVVFLNQ